MITTTLDKPEAVKLLAYRSEGVRVGLSTTEGYLLEDGNLQTFAEELREYAATIQNIAEIASTVESSN